VGCVIAKEGRIIATGYNGPLGGTEHCNSENCDLDKACEHALHAEANAIAFSAKKGIALEGSVLWCTHGPCKKCAELIVQAGVIEVNYLKPYRSSEGVNLLIKNQIIVRGYEED
jgi:dCMP deaminase